MDESKNCKMQGLQAAASCNYRPEGQKRAGSSMCMCVCGACPRRAFDTQIALWEESNAYNEQFILKNVFIAKLSKEGIKNM